MLRTPPWKREVDRLSRREAAVTEAVVSFPPVTLGGTEPALPARQISRGRRPLSALGAGTTLAAGPRT